MKEFLISIGTLAILPVIGALWACTHGFWGWSWDSVAIGGLLGFLFNTPIAILAIYWNDLKRIK